MAKNTNLITNADVSADILTSPFVSDTDRIKYMSHAYSNMNIAKAFGVYYNTDVNDDIKNNRTINTVTNIELGKVYLGTVTSFDGHHIEFDIPGCKDEIICKENFSDCVSNVQSYLMQHDNKLLFQVRDHNNGKYIVSVLEAYYQKWQKEINDCIKKDQAIQVHIDNLVNGGYVCHTHITTLYELTGKLYQHAVFIPGSQIVLNIEDNFDKWVGQDVLIIPKKFVEFNRNMRTGEIENSLVGSRKAVLQIQGGINLDVIYQQHQLIEQTKSAKPTYVGTVTGIINSQKKRGVFVELDDKYITGLMPVDNIDTLLDYKHGDKINVRIKEFEVQEGKDPFIYNKKGVVVRCNCRPVFELA